MSDTYREEDSQDHEFADCKNDASPKLHFAERLREAIGAESKLAFAKRCGISDSLIGRYLRGESYPGIEKLPAIASATGKSMGWLIGGADDMSGSGDSREELEKWWMIIFDSLTESEQHRVIHTFKRHGSFAVFAEGVVGSDEATPTVNKEIFKQRDSDKQVGPAPKLSTQSKAG